MVKDPRSAGETCEGAKKRIRRPAEGRPCTSKTPTPAKPSCINLGPCDHVCIMTNRARSSFKALQFLQFRPWQLDPRSSVGAVVHCLQCGNPPYSHLCRSGLVHRPSRPPRPQNAAVRHIAGAFRTTPVIDLRIGILTKNAALRLYRLPLNSQLITRAPVPWGQPKAGLIPFLFSLPAATISLTSGLLQQNSQSSNGLML